jgi:hypothetical protein
VELASYRSDIFSSKTGDHDLVAMRVHITTTFRRNFAAGVRAYMDGEWNTARGTQV